MGKFSDPDRSRRSRKEKNANRRGKALHAMKDWRQKGISLKTTSILMMMISLIITVGLVIADVRVHGSFGRMEESTDDYIRMGNAATELMAASDYLT